MTTYLDAILAAHRRQLERDSRHVDGLLALLEDVPEPRPFTASLLVHQHGVLGEPIAVIAEIKRRSPSKGDLAPALDPAELAHAYERAGAACVSVLTDREFFGGSAQDLAIARASTSLPVLRKDFTVGALDVYDARAMGADALLLIVAALSDGELAELHGLANELSMDVLVEVHDEAELERALGVGARLIGVNQRDLSSFEVDTSRAVRVAKAIPEGVVKVAESGVHSREDLRRLADAGFDAVLVGEALVTAPDPGEALVRLRGAGPTTGAP